MSRSAHVAAYAATCADVTYPPHPLGRQACEKQHVSLALEHVDGELLFAQLPKNSTKLVSVCCIKGQSSLRMDTTYTRSLGPELPASRESQHAPHCHGWTCLRAERLHERGAAVLLRLRAEAAHLGPQRVDRAHERVDLGRVEVRERAQLRGDRRVGRRRRGQVELVPRGPRRHRGCHGAPRLARSRARSVVVRVVCVVCERGRGRSSAVAGCRMPGMDGGSTYGDVVLVTQKNGFAPVVASSTMDVYHSFIMMAHHARAWNKILASRTLAARPTPFGANSTDENSQAGRSTYGLLWRSRRAARIPGRSERRINENDV